MLYNNNNGKGFNIFNTYSLIQIYNIYSIQYWFTHHLYHTNDYLLKFIQMTSVYDLRYHSEAYAGYFIWGPRRAHLSKINMSRVFSIITGINHFKTKAHHLGGTFLNCIALKVFKPFVDSQRTITVHRCKERHTVQKAYTSGMYLVSEQFCKRLGCWYLGQNFETV